MSIFPPVFRVLYIYITRTSLDVFNCAWAQRHSVSSTPAFNPPPLTLTPCPGVPTNPPDGTTYMAGLLQYPCGGPVQVMLLFPAIVGFVVYSVALPAAALWFLRAKRNIVK